MEGQIRIVRPSSREREELLPKRLGELAKRGIRVAFDDLPPDTSWLYAAASASERAAALERALLEPTTFAVLAARGGYGASDLLPLLDWERLSQAAPKLLVGFSDVSALHAALYTKLGWAGLHAPMPATSLWGQGDDVEQLLTALADYHQRGQCGGSIAVEAVRASPRPIGGRLLGGCFSVLTNLIGTAYLPRSLDGCILYFEDTDEHPARLMRYLNQWLQSGLFDGVRALVLGHLRKLGEAIPDCAPFVYEQFARRVDLPVYRSQAFGHTAPNFPLAFGGEAHLDNASLSWNLTRRIWRHECII